MASSVSSESALVKDGGEVKDPLADDEPVSGTGSARISDTDSQKRDAKGRGLEKGVDPSETRSSRIYFGDNMRAVFMALIVMAHVMMGYGSWGVWPVVNAATDDISPRLFTLLLAYFALPGMTIFFFLAGYFTPRSFNKKGAASFLKGKLLRLSIPTIIYALLLSPWIEQMSTQFMTTAPKSFGAVWVSMADGSNAGYLATGLPFCFPVGPMWFLTSLLLFFAGYVVYRKASARWGWKWGKRRGDVNPMPDLHTPAAGGQDLEGLGIVAGSGPSAGAGAGASSSPSGSGEPLQFIDEHGNIDGPGERIPLPLLHKREVVKVVIPTLVVLWLVTFLIRIGSPTGFLVPYLGSELGYHAVYIAWFIFGILAWENSWMPQLQYVSMRWWYGALAFFVLSLPLAMGFAPDSTLDNSLGGWHWENLVFSWWETFSCCTMVIVIIHTFQRFFDRPPKTQLWRALVSCYYPVYVVHVPIICALTGAFLPLPWPSLAKFVLVYPLAYLGSNLVAFLMSRMPGVRRVVA